MRTKLHVTFFALVCVSLVLGQGERGTFNGTVEDSSGAVIPNASVKAVNTATGVETAAQTTMAGVYRIPYLPPGNYRLSATATGFRTGVRDNIFLSVAQTLTLDFALELGTVTEAVTVSSDPPLIESGSSEIGSYVTRKELDAWPITVTEGQRQLQQFIFTSLPGSVGGTYQGSINGGQYFSHEILIDGISIGRMDIQGGSNNAFSPSAESISEFKLQTGTVSAQYGGGQTALANFAFKSGTNELHGAGYTYIQNDALQANSWTSNAAGIPRQPFRQTNLGYSVGAPIYIPKVYNGRNKSFFFHNLDYTRVRNFSSTSFLRLPTRDFKQGDFSRLLLPSFTGNADSGRAIGADALGRTVPFGAIYDPVTSRQVGSAWVRDPFPGNAIPKARWDPVSQKVLELAPVEDPLFDTMLNNTPRIAAAPMFAQKILTAKIDHILSSKHRLAGSFNRNFRARYTQVSWGPVPGTPTATARWQDTPGTMVRFAHDWTVAPTVLNHFAAGYNRFGNVNNAISVDQHWPAKIGLQNLPGTHFPMLTFGGQPYQGGGIGNGGNLSDNNAYLGFNGSTIIQDDLTWVRGKHNVKLGFEMRRYYYNLGDRASESGVFNFSPAQTAQPGFNTQTGHAFASFLLGAVASTNRRVIGSTFGHRWRSTGFYLTDDYKVSRKLTLNLGLRWEIISPLYEVARRMAGFSASTPNPGAGGRAGAMVWVDDLGRNSFQDTYWKQLSPKFGFAYALTAKLVVRGGYGINNSPPVINSFSVGGTEGYNSSIARNAANTSLRFAEDQVAWFSSPYPLFADTLPQKNPSIANGRAATFFPADANRLAYVQNWNLGFQYLLPKSFVLEINYIGNKGTRLEADGFMNLNALPVSYLERGQSLTDPWTASSGIPQPYPGFSGTQLQALRPYPQYTGVTSGFNNIGTSNYNALQVQATRHFRNGLAVLGAYTWSKAIGLASSAMTGETPADLFNLRLERSILDFNRPGTLKVTWMYELPMGPGKAIRVAGVAGQILGGWTVSGIHQVRSGSPVSIGGGTISNPLGVARPDLVLGQSIVLNSDAPINFRGKAGGVAYLNREAFALPPVYPGGRNVIRRLGTLGPVLPNIRGPHFTGEDFAVYKTCRFGESRSVEVRATFLNPFNRHGRGGLDTNLASPFFGQLTGVQTGGRNIELSARIVF